MKKLLIVVFGVLFTSSAISANWVAIKTDEHNNTYSIDTTRIKKVATFLSTTPEVRSVWIQLNMFEEKNGAKHVLFEQYYKCRDHVSAMNTLVNYRADGTVINSNYNISGTSADFAKYTPVLPGSVGEDIEAVICALTAS